MTAGERRASASLAAIFALRMLGLFLVLPVFALEAARYPGGDDPLRVGLALGIYGLTQALLQIPLGMASDRWGRKRVIQGGLLLFAVGSLVAAWAPTLEWLTVGRALQGAGAISAAITAFLADVTRDEVRTKAMAMVGISIALTFALSLATAPLLVTVIGLHGLFGLTAALALLGMAVVAWVVPPEPLRLRPPQRASLRSVLLDARLARLNVGVFVLHAVQLACWVALPALLLQAGLAAHLHGWVYLVAVLAAFVVMGALLFRLERRGFLRAVFLFAIGLIVLAQLGLWWASAAAAPNWMWLFLCLLVFFIGFNTLEASQPSLVSKMASAEQRGAALGVYNTLQSLGFFTGGALGGAVLALWGPSGLFLACAALALLWLLVAWRMPALPAAPPKPKRSGAP
ncbi:MFS transporter [Serpentinimonas barnesii]|uniref:MFS transporter n=1 Tax=Serpentinimonas barnesii TaxID=1458427 RepID=UPI0005EEEBF2|nr:MFS transporter [Serpentinimonas barnesii]